MNDTILYVFGGGTGSQALGDLWALDVSPEPRDWQWVCLRANPVPLRLPGQKKGEPAKEDDVYKRALIRDHGGPGPSPRGYHCAIITQNTLIIVGGSNGTQCYNDVWFFDLGVILSFVFCLRGGMTDKRTSTHSHGNVEGSRSEFED